MNSKLKDNPYVGSTLDSLFAETGELREVRRRTREKVTAFNLAQEMKKSKVSPSELAARMNTSRTSVYRLLDPSYAGATVKTLSKAAKAIGCDLEIRLVKRSA